MNQQQKQRAAKQLTETLEEQRRAAAANRAFRHDCCRKRLERERLQRATLTNSITKLVSLFESQHNCNQITQTSKHSHLIHHVLQIIESENTFCEGDGHLTVVRMMTRPALRCLMNDQNARRENGSICRENTEIHWAKRQSLDSHS